jgi:hypothetical protein
MTIYEIRQAYFDGVFSRREAMFRLLGECRLSWRAALLVLGEDA